MDVADTSRHSADSICSDDTEYLLGQNVSIREIEDDDLPVHEHGKINSTFGRSQYMSPQCSPKKPQQVNSKNVISSSKKDVKVKTVRGQDEYHRSPSRSIDKHLSSMEPHMNKVKGKKSKGPHDFISNEVAREHSEMVQNSYRSKGVLQSQELEGAPKSSKSISDSYAKYTHIQGNFQSPESHKSVHVQSHHMVTGIPKLRAELHYDHPSRLTPPTRERQNAKIRPTEPARLPVRQNVPVVQDNWEIDSQISLDTLNGGNNVEVESNDLESQVSEATEDLMRGEDEDDEDITDKLKELNLAVNYDTNTNGKY